MEKLFLSAILLSLSFYLPAGVLETAQTAKGFQEIICSSNGKAGGLSPGKALAGLRKGMTFKLLSGDYDSEILITHDKVIITGDPTKPCAATNNQKILRIDYLLLKNTSDKEWNTGIL
jgi:hypothetical protein